MASKKVRHDVKLLHDVKYTEGNNEYTEDIFKKNHEHTEVYLPNGKYCVYPRMV